jgi:RND family efflux transporter MFP subunit
MAETAASAARERLPVVTVVEPTRKAAIRSITLPASVEAYEKATLYSKVAGYLKWIRVDVGDTVRQGEVLAEIELPEMEKEYQSAEASVRLAEADAERARADVKFKELTHKRLESVRESQPNVISQQEVDVARAAHESAEGDAKLTLAKLDLMRSKVEELQAEMVYAKIISPYDGVVTERFVDRGALIQRGTNSTGNVAPVVTVASIDRIRVYLSVPEPGVPSLRQGAAARVSLEAFPGKTFEGKVTRFATALDPQTRTMKTYVELPNPGHLIRPGMYGTTELELTSELNALFPPAQSIRRDSQGQTFVYTVTEGRVRKTAVETGLDDGKLIQVKGLRGDETVIQTSTAPLQEGLSVKTVRASS